MWKKWWAKIMASLALFWIVIWIIWTWLLFIFWSNNQTEQDRITPEQYSQLQQLLKSQTWAVNNIKENTIETNTWTGSKESPIIPFIKEDEQEENTNTGEIVETNTWTTNK
jgi:hypothetical protein